MAGQLRLTGREQEIVGLLLEGCTNKQIASRLGVSGQTVKNQLSTLYQKAAVHNRLALVAQVLRSGVRPRVRGLGGIAPDAGQ